MKKYRRLIQCCLLVLILVACRKTEEPIIEDSIEDKVKEENTTNEQNSDENKVDEKNIDEKNIDESNKIEDLDQSLKGPEGIYGQLEGSSYVNDFFEIRIDLPEEGYGLPQNQLETMTEKGIMIVEEGEEVEQISTYILLAYFEHPIEDQMPMNMNIIGTAEIGVKNQVMETNHELIVEMIQASGIEVYDQGLLPSVMISDQSFIHYNVTFNGGLETLRQDYFISVIKGYRVMFVETQRQDVPSVLMEQIEAIKE